MAQNNKETSVDDVLRWINVNWMVVSLLITLGVQSMFIAPTVQRTSKNVEAIAKCLIKSGLLSPNDVELAQIVEFKGIKL
jgi:hypothetical protein